MGGDGKKKNIFPFYTGHDGVCTVAAYPTLISILIEKGFSSSEAAWSLAPRVVMCAAGESRVSKTRKAPPPPSEHKGRQIAAQPAEGEVTQCHFRADGGACLLIYLIRKQCK